MDQRPLVSKTPPPPDRRKRNIIASVVTVAIVGTLIWCWLGTEAGPKLLELFSADPPFKPILNFLGRMFPPDLGWSMDEPGAWQPSLRVAGEAVVITLQIAFLGTAMGMSAALILGFLGAENLTPHWVHHPVKIFLALLRSIPVILLALMFVGSMGFGPFPGVLAIAIHSVGMLGKLFAEECENVEVGIWEAMDSAGAGWPAKVRYAIWPQVAPQVFSLTLFRLDMNIRESAVLGFVGVAGLGLWFDIYRKAGFYHHVCTLVIVTMIVVLIIDQISFHIRRRLK